MTSDLIAALPMYDWPERRAEVDAEWATLRKTLRSRGIDAPETLVRRNADMPAVTGGIRDENGAVIAPDPSTLPPDDLDLPTLWRHPALLFGQTCWGPMQLGLNAHVSVVDQPDYTGIEGGAGPLYSSAIIMRRTDVADAADERSPEDGRALLPLERMRGKSFAFNSTDSMSGYLGIKRDLEQAGDALSIFSRLIETGAHRASLRAVAAGEAEIAAIDARSWHLARFHETCMDDLVVVGWTSRSKGLPFISAKSLSLL